MVSLACLELIRPPKVELKPAPTSASGWNCSWPVVVFEGSWVRFPLAAAAAITEAAAAEAETDTGRLETKDVGTELKREEKAIHFDALMCQQVSHCVHFIFILPYNTIHRGRYLG